MSTQSSFLRHGGCDRYRWASQIISFSAWKNRVLYNILEPYYHYIVPPICPMFLKTFYVGWSRVALTSAAYTEAVAVGVLDATVVRPCRPVLLSWLYHRYSPDEARQCHCLGPWGQQTKLSKNNWPIVELRSIVRFPLKQFRDADFTVRSSTQFHNETTVGDVDSWRTAKFFDWQHRIFIYRLYSNTTTPTHPIGHRRAEPNARTMSHQAVFSNDMQRVNGRCLDRNAAV